MLSAADHALFAHAAEHHSVFTLADAVAAGLTERQIRARSAGHWLRIHEGVFRAPGAAWSWKGDLRAAILAAGPGSAISHRSGAALYELPGGNRRLIELTCKRWDRAVRPGLVVHEARRLDGEDVQPVDGIPTTSPELLILHLAALWPSPDWVERLIHAARRKRLITYESTQATFERHARRGVRGTRAMRSALERWDPTQTPTESDMETLLLQAIRGHGLAEPVLQFEVRDRRGAVVARVDAAYPDMLLTLEYDSKQEHSDEFQLAQDARRRNVLAALGYRTLSARHADLKQGGGELCHQIRAILRTSSVLV
jgi:very-short-patch-repair endonuclease